MRMTDLDPKLAHAARLPSFILWQLLEAGGASVATKEHHLTSTAGWRGNLRSRDAA
jgi:hypothetical protein